VQAAKNMAAKNIAGISQRTVEKAERIIIGYLTPCH
jgi:hypothetical protein